MSEGQATAIDSGSVTKGAPQTAATMNFLLGPVGWGVTIPPVESSMPKLHRHAAIGRHRGSRAFLAFAVLLGVWATRTCAQDHERPPILYSQTAPHNSASELQSRIINGTSTLRHEPHFGRLRSLLEELKIPASSQVLVFSKTSLQRENISPATPRAIYFSDNAYVGFCQGGAIMEVSVADPLLGTVFYSVSQVATETPALVREGENCLVCHASSQTDDVPAHLMRSVFVDSQGFPLLAFGSYRVDQTTPFRHRFGGWYVTGTHGDQPHLGNLVISGTQRPPRVENSHGCNLTDLRDRLDMTAYLTPHSDLIALMVLVHQAKGHSLIARAGIQTRLALHQEQELNRELQQPSNKRWESTSVRINSAAETLTRYLLFSEEASLTSALSGTTSFAQEFSRQGPMDSQGRSLREFELSTRLFKYPLSYLIYTPVFDALPEELKEMVWRRIWEVLRGSETSRDFAHLSPSDKWAIVQIVRETKQGLPEYWTADAPVR